jgi:hypothetical protein
MRFTGVIEAATGGGSRVEVPFDARAEFGEARPPVETKINGHPYHSRLMVYGGRTYLGLTKAIRAQAGVEIGDGVQIELSRDEPPRVVDVPDELAAAFERTPEARARFDALSFSHRREYAQWVAEAKRDETRARRASKTVQMLLASVQHP